MPAGMLTGAVCNGSASAPAPGSNREHFCDVGLLRANQMKIPAMVLAAGRGERMRPLTDHHPKPLLTVQGRPLIEWVLRALAGGACSRVVINTAWLGDQLPGRLGQRFSPGLDGSALHTALDLYYSNEGQDFGRALETAGGISRALPILLPQEGDEFFWLAAGDVFAPDFAFDGADVERFVASKMLAHLWLVPNPAHHPRGDFGISAQGLALNVGPDDPRPSWTYSTVGLYRRALFRQPWCAVKPGNPMGESLALAPLLRKAMDQGLVAASVYEGLWVDVGTPERLAIVNQATMRR